MDSRIVKHQYNGFSISQRADGLVNLTEMAKAGGKLIADYLRKKSTKVYVEALSRDMSIDISQLLVVVKGNSGGQQQGTWGHYEIAMDCAQWVHVQLRIWANRTLIRVVNESQQPPAQQKLAPAVEINLLADAFGKLGLLDSPRHLQLAQDYAANLLGANSLPSSDFSEPIWEGVVEIAEDIGYRPTDVYKVRSQLGKAAAAWYRVEFGEEPLIEKRLVEGRRTPVKVYQRNDDLVDLVHGFMDARNFNLALRIV